MMKESILVVCGLALGFGMGTLKYCGERQPITMTLISGLPEEAPVPLFHKGDVIEWIGPTPGNAKLNVTFEITSPCVEGADVSIPKCTVNVDVDPYKLAMYTYTCDNHACPDPEVPVGSKYQTAKDAAFVPARTNLNDHVTVACKAGTSTAVEKIATAGETFYWVGAGNPQPGWSITGVGTGMEVCSQGPSFSSPANNVCTAQKNGANPYTVNYNVTVDGCAMGTGKLTVNP
jgi:hypothetical protein